MNYLTRAKSPSEKKYDELNEQFDRLEKLYKESVIKRNDIAARYLSLQKTHRDKVIAMSGMKAYYEKAENEHINLIVKMRPIYEIYCNEVKELQGEELKRNEEKSDPLADGKLHIYHPGTIKPKSTYTDDIEKNIRDAYNRLDDNLNTEDEEE